MPALRRRCRARGLRACAEARPRNIVLEGKVKSFNSGLRQAVRVVVLCLLMGCGAQDLRQAQDHFNRGANMELKALDQTLQVDSLDATPVDAVAALNEYRLAEQTARKLIAEKADSLRRDRLLGTTYILQAMALWRISDLEGDTIVTGEAPSDASRSGTDSESGDTEENSRQALLALLGEIETRKDKLSLGTRDRVLHKALYGFYDHDGGRSADDYFLASKWFRSAIKRLDESVSGDVPERHPVRFYVGSAQLRTLAAWSQRNIETQGSHYCRDHAEMEPHACADKIAGDSDEINAATSRVTCGLKTFWSGKNEIRSQLDKFLQAIGLPSAINNCPS